MFTDKEAADRFIQNWKKNNPELEIPVRFVVKKPWRKIRTIEDFEMLSAVLERSLRVSLSAENLNKAHDLLRKIRSLCFKKNGDV